MRLRRQLRLHLCFTVLAIAAEEIRKMMTMDIGNAFLHALMLDGMNVHVHLDEINTAFLSQILHNVNL